MPIEIKMLTLGMAQTNAYLVGDTDTQRAILIDPVDRADLLIKAAEDSGWTIALILGTHAHFDHILASKALKDQTDAPFYIHEECREWLEKLPEQGRRFGLGNFPEAATPDRWLTSESEMIELDSIRLKTLYTPGHAPGHLAFYMQDEGVVFSGDALFRGSIGRVDLPGGNYDLLMLSIGRELLPLPDETVVLAGHMGQTTIGQEKLTNPYILSYDYD